MVKLAKEIPATLVKDQTDRQSDLLSRSELASEMVKGAAAMLTGILGMDVLSSMRAAQTLKVAGVLEKSPTPVLDVLDQVVSSIIDGTSIVEQYPTIARLVHAQDKRSDIVGKLLLTNDYRRITNATRARDHLEDQLIVAAQNDTLLPAERIILREALDQIVDKTSKRIAGSSSEMSDITAVLEKMDYAVEVSETQLRERYTKTSAQGREIARKMLIKVGKAIRSASKPSEDADG